MRPISSQPFVSFVRTLLLLGLPIGGPPWVGDAIAAPAALPTLRFTSEGRFKIVQFADTHLTDLESHGGNEKLPEPEQKELAERLATELLAEMGRILDQEKPQLVVFTGDNVVTKNQPFDRWRRLLAPVTSREIAWAAVLGNHDREWTGKSGLEIMTFLQSLPYSLAGPGEGVLGGGGNYILTVGSAGNTAGAKGKNAGVGSKTKIALYLMDSGDYADKRLCDGYAWFAAPQVDWFRHRSRELASANGGQALPALAFFHIPFQEFRHDIREEKMIGVAQEDICHAKVNAGMFAAMLESRAIMGAFVGHDHDNDYALGHLGICLAYGRKTGSFSYHHLPEGGARVIELREGTPGFVSWIRTATGAEVSRFTFPADLTVEPAK